MSRPFGYLRTPKVSLAVERTPLRLGEVHGELAQLIAVAAHGSGWLAGRTGDAPPDLEHGNSTFQYVNSVRFELPGRLLRGPTVSSSIAEWLVEIRRRGVVRLSLATSPERFPDRNLLAFVGTFPAAIVGSSAGRPLERWSATWTVGDKDAPVRRIWDVAYRVERDPKVTLAASNVVHATDELTTALQRATAFARSHDLDHWAAIFEAALGLDHAGDPVPPYHPDMFPSTAFGRGPRRLLAMATRAWVFGGMGSWNDVAFQGADAQAYDDVSDGLLAAVLAAFVAAVNGSLDR